MPTLDRAIVGASLMSLHGRAIAKGASRHRLAPVCEVVVATDRAWPYSPGSTRVCSIRTAIRDRELRPSAARMVGAIWVVCTGAATECALSNGLETSSATLVS